MWQHSVRDERGQCLDHTDQHASKHCANQVANTSKHCRCKGDQTKCKTKIENCAAELQAVDQTSRTCKCRANEERNCNDAVNIYTHQSSRFTVLRDSTHCTSRACTGN